MTSAIDEPAVLISHPTGNQNVRNAVQSLAEHNMLAEFWTAIAWQPESRWNPLLPDKLKMLLARRTFQEAPRDQVKSVPWREMVRLGARSSPFGKLLTAGERPFSVVGMYRNFDAKVAQRLRELEADAVYAYEGGALQTFREARRQGIAALYELTTGHWNWKRNRLREEAECNPESAGLLSQLNDSARHLDEKSEELQLADLVFVPSQHVRRTLAGVVPDEKIRVLCYGAPQVRERNRIRQPASRPLKVLFAGALSRQKGIGYLLDAIDLLDSRVELTLVGRRLGADRRVDEACNKWRWFETIPHRQVLEVMMESDVLVLPSFSEGFGLVVTEALACGVPVIVTPEVGASDLVSDGREGFVVPVGSGADIADRLSALDRDRELLAQMSQNAQITAAAHTWENYRRTFAETVAETVRTSSWR
jgi:glycosyltransferase involved in cell wall biosynthesis